MSTDIAYTCGACNLEIAGRSWDPQEAPVLECPECGDEMELEVEWS